MKKVSLLLFFTIGLFFSCSTSDSGNTDNTEYFWVDSKRVDCIGVGEQTCYKVQENKVVNVNDWGLFYDGIEGFDEQYETGYIYQLTIIKENIDNPPADASSIRYILNEVISKKRNK